MRRKCKMLRYAGLPLVITTISQIYYYREDSGLVANEQRSQHKLVMALCYARQKAT